MSNKAATFGTRLSKLPPIALWLKIKPYINKFFMSPWFFAFEFIAAAVIILLGKEVEGALFFLGIMLLGMIFCDDLLFLLQTLCLAAVFLTNCYDSADTFMPYIRYLPIVVVAVAIHFICYNKRIHIGRNFWGSLAVTVAVTLGGLGTISVANYFSLTALYYVCGLGVGMLLVYIVAGAYVEEKKDYDIFERFAAILYVMGLLSVFMIAKFHLTSDVGFTSITAMIASTWTLQAQNNLSTMMMIAMPFPCYFALKNRIHLHSLLLIYAGIVFSGSRGGLIMGSVELLFCIAYLIYADKKMRLVYIILGVLGVSFAAIKILQAFELGDIIKYLTYDDTTDTTEPRIKLLGRMVEDFRSNPLFGRGLGYSGNSDIYSPVKGAMHWYHMMIPQVVGSLGIFGIVAYSYQFVLRVRTVFRKVDNYKLVMGTSYLGLFLMSQVNPGEFCPIPYAMIGVLIFMMLEKYDKSRRLP